MDTNDIVYQMKKPIGHSVKVGLLALTATIGFDLFLHAGVLNPLYSGADPFLLSPEESFQRIPLGYLSFAILTIMILWLMNRLEIEGWKRGLVFGLIIGGLVWGSLVLGLFSISTAKPLLLIAWFLGQTAELGISGMVIGSGLAAEKLRPLLVKVLIFFVIAVVLGIVIQNIWNTNS